MEIHLNTKNTLFLSSFICLLFIRTKQIIPKIDTLIFHHILVYDFNYVSSVSIEAKLKVKAKVKVKVVECAPTMRVVKKSFIYALGCKIQSPQV